MNLYILKYNNYFNRLVKRENNLSSYLKYQVGDVIENVNFKPNDGVNTYQILNKQPTGLGDYLLAVEDNEIKSRWFIIESIRTRGGQYRLELRRDLVVDNYADIINAPCFIEKATLNNNDPLIYNKEDMSFNQIKTSETALKDETGCAWVVGYIPRDAFSTEKEIQGNVILDNTADITVSSLSNWEYYKYVGLGPTNDAYNSNYFNATPSNINYGAFVYRSSKGIVSYIGRGCNSNGISLSSETIAVNSDYTRIITGSKQFSLGLYEINTTGLNINSLATNLSPNPYETWCEHWQQNIATINQQAATYYGFNNAQATSNFLALNGKVLLDTSTDLYHRIVINKRSTNKTYQANAAGNLYSQLDTLLWRSNPNGAIDLVSGSGSTSTLDISGTANGNNYLVNFISVFYDISLEQIPQTAKVTIDSNRYHLEDQPYDMFCLPYSNDLKIYKDGTQILTANKSIAINMAIEVGADAGTGSIYDIQLLPYCPVRYMIKEDGTFDIGSAKVHYIKNASNENIGVILWATTSSFTLNITNPITVTDKKIENETDMYRLVSPNYNGQFEFSAAMNNGVDYFNVDCSYKPFNPYIHINPNFKGLYGQDFNDARGLICSGDFSLPQLSNAWANYELNNKNYNTIFERQIQNLQTNNKIQREKEQWGAGLGAVSGLLSGATSGALIGGPIGGVLGGLVGGASSALAGAEDIRLNDKLRNEAIDFARDQFNSQLGNIQAQPTSIAKTSALTYNNKIYPILEYYTCTDKEKQALKDKLKYNGMTVMAIGKIADYIRQTPSYIKGKIIRLENLHEDTNYLNEIANEINKGVFI